MALKFLGVCALHVHVVESFVEPPVAAFHREEWRAVLPLKQSMSDVIDNK